MEIAIIVIVAIMVAVAMLIRAYRKHMTLDAEQRAEVEQWLQRRK